jgi:hypothetical protein
MSSRSAPVFVSQVVLTSLGLTLIIAFLAALPRSALVIVLEVASAGAAATVALILARNRRAPRASARSSRTLQARPTLQWSGSKEG